MDRLTYADTNRQRYLDWGEEIARSPCTPIELLEFAVISAHTPMAVAIAGWRAARAHADMTELAEALHYAGVLAPYNKAAAIAWLRELNPRPTFPYREYRRNVKLPGLGLCKLSFGCCLIDPFGSDIVCLDTHLLRVYYERRPTERERRRVYRKPLVYEVLESQLKQEAESVALPPFLYQWAVWDWKRAAFDRKPPLNHSFLWRDPKDYQLPLFSSVEV